MIDEQLSRICRTPNEANILSEILALLSKKLEFEGSDFAREKLLSDLLRYLERKPNRKPIQSTDEFDYLRNVRNLMAHKKSVPLDEIGPAIPVFWKVLGDVADDFNWNELSRLLTYALHLPEPPPMKANSSSKNRIKKYENVFNSISWEQKIYIFRNLLLMIFETPEFQNHLKNIKNRNYSY